MASDAELLMLSMICAWINYWVNKSEAGDLKRHRAHYDVIAVNEQVVICQFLGQMCTCKSTIVSRAEGTVIYEVEDQNDRNITISRKIG